MDGARLLRALEARPDLVPGLQDELQTRDVAACIRELVSPLTGGSHVSHHHADVAVLVRRARHTVLHEQCTG